MYLVSKKRTMLNVHMGVVVRDNFGSNYVLVQPASIFAGYLRLQCWLPLLDKTTENDYPVSVRESSLNLCLSSENSN